ncbi:MAG: cbb3-type cytochrome oxidase assembly protein CcoS [Cytophagaceae bacterium]|nr:cbb3-type cytochrome oxidase assembly protein CcoS [Cytophagaceae bacterium]
MSVIFILILISILIACTFLGLFIWAIKKGQFEDDYSPSVRILFEDELKKDLKTNNHKNEHVIN